MTKPRIIGMILIVAAAASLGLVTIGFQSTIASIPFVDLEEAVEAGNATNMAGTTNQTTTNGNMTDVQFLFIQNAQSASVSQINATAYTLELNNVANKTIMFSDRPNRIVESVSTADFIGNWSAGPNSFASDVPNDALIVKDTQTGNLDTAIIESFNPVYDTNTNTLTYTIVAENATSIDLPSEFGGTVLVIDSTFPNATPGDYS